MARFEPRVVRRTANRPAPIATPPRRTTPTERSSLIIDRGWFRLWASTYWATFVLRIWNFRLQWMISNKKVDVSAYMKHEH